ncbi:syntaxin-1A-like [Neodiprion lecontei]|uniref:Syntaxin-1A-like n=1 Tax=Neodiprion lecontei TaxID=441921 RepID=A0A6J0BMX0_NEOLC|nr:syntaxin-1A-like [Neodiprion lecontei]XP_046428139.1 syntaxin-1A-like [Neodiprion fabricii]
MTRDRLPDLCAARKHSASFGTGFLQDVHIQISQNKKLNKVLEEVEETRMLIQLIADNSNVIKELHNDVLSYNNREIQVELDTRTQVISETATRVQKKLKDMEKEITLVEDLSVETAKEGPIHMRIKILQYSTMSRLFGEVMREYNESLLRYQEKYTSLLYQQKLLTQKQCTNEEFQEMLDSKETDLFVDNILQDTSAVRQQLSDLQTRHEEFLKIEKSIVEVRDMFVEMAFLVEKQSERLNCVEYFAGIATDNVDNGRFDLSKAEKKGHKYKKRKIKILIVISLIVLVLILIAIFF